MTKQGKSVEFKAKSKPKSDYKGMRAAGLSHHESKAAKLSKQDVSLLQQMLARANKSS